MVPVSISGAGLMFFFLFHIDHETKRTISSFYSSWLNVKEEQQRIQIKTDNLATVQRVILMTLLLLIVNAIYWNSLFVFNLFHCSSSSSPLFAFYCTKLCALVTLYMSPWQHQTTFHAFLRRCDSSMIYHEETIERCHTDSAVENLDSGHEEILEASLRATSRTERKWFNEKFTLSFNIVRPDTETNSGLLRSNVKRPKKFLFKA